MFDVSVLCWSFGKGYLLRGETIPFALPNHTFWRAKGMV